MLKVVALTSGRYAPSSRFRVRQYIAPLAAEGIHVREFAPRIDKYQNFPSLDAAGSRSPLTKARYRALLASKVITRLPGIAGSRRADITWLERELLSAHRTLEGLLGRPYILDLDDAVWLQYSAGGAGLRRSIREAESVFAGNGFIAEYCCPLNSNVEHIPTAVSCSRFVPGTPPEGRFVVGWTGSSSNFRYLKRIEPAIAAFLGRSDARLLVVADMEPRLTSIDPSKVQFVRWTEDNEVRAVRAMHVGLAPLPNDDWARGKCGLKVLQYLACGRPVITSPVGANIEIVGGSDVGTVAGSLSAWTEAMESMYQDRDKLEKMGAAGRQLVLAKYSVDTVAPLIAQAFCRAGCV